MHTVFIVSLSQPHMHLHRLHNVTFRRFVFFLDLCKKSVKQFKKNFHQVSDPYAVEKISMEKISSSYTESLEKAVASVAPFLLNAHIKDAGSLQPKQDSIKRVISPKHFSKDKNKVTEHVALLGDDQTRGVTRRQASTTALFDELIQDKVIRVQPMLKSSKSLR